MNEIEKGTYTAPPGSGLWGCAHCSECRGDGERQRLD
jgi:hypothetical protein